MVYWTIVTVFGMLWLWLLLEFKRAPHIKNRD